ncbi:BnaA09g09800D [Brassica napus]|uniref:BnaA09g09800D protein n=2 Tax=Brassica napus TaxID=3708 RepID=A0A078GYG3_BRANA|nr:BnaA09g09800D [Brassica napus]
MPINRDPSTPPPVIGKIGPYTVFMTPPATPKPPESPSAVSQKPIVQPPVLPPPQQFKSVASSEQDGSVLGFFKNAVTKVQNAHSSVDDHLVRWFGLNQSKYQWALDEYYEGKGSSGMKSVEAKEMPGKVQSV